MAEQTIDTPVILDASNMRLFCLHSSHYKASKFNVPPRLVASTWRLDVKGMAEMCLGFINGESHPLSHGKHLANGVRTI